MFTRRFLIISTSVVLFFGFSFATDKETAYADFGKIFLLGASAPVEKNLTNKLQISQAKQKNAALSTLAIKTIRAVCKLFNSGDISFFDPTDGANQCHLNTLLIVKGSQNEVFKKFCNELTGLSDHEMIEKVLLKNDNEIDLLRLLTLSMLRYVPDAPVKMARDYTFNDLSNILEIDDYAKTLLSNSQRFQRGAGLPIGIAICKELANLRFKIYQEILDQHPDIVESAHKNGFNIPKNILDACYQPLLRKSGNDVIYTLPKLLSLTLFLSAYQSGFFQEKPIYIKFMCDGKVIGYADSSLEKLRPSAPHGPMICIKMVSDDPKNPKKIKALPDTGLLEGYSPKDLILMGGAYFVEKYQPEGKVISRKFMPDFDQILNNYLAIQKDLGIHIIHFNPVENVNIK